MPKQPQDRRPPAKGYRPKPGNQTAGRGKPPTPPTGRGSASGLPTQPISVQEIKRRADETVQAYQRQVEAQKRSIDRLIATLQKCEDECTCEAVTNVVNRERIGADAEG